MSFTKVNGPFFIWFSFAVSVASLSWGDLDRSLVKKLLRVILPGKKRLKVLQCCWKILVNILLVPPRVDSKETKSSTSWLRPGLNLGSTRSLTVYVTPPV